jgi:hypothetical protein
MEQPAAALAANGATPAVCGIVGIQGAKTKAT